MSNDCVGDVRRKLLRCKLINHPVLQIMYENLIEHFNYCFRQNLLKISEKDQKIIKLLLKTNLLI